MCLSCAGPCKKHVRAGLRGHTPRRLLLNRCTLHCTMLDPSHLDPAHAQLGRQSLCTAGFAVRGDLYLCMLIVSNLGSRRPCERWATQPWPKTLKAFCRSRFPICCGLSPHWEFNMRRCSRRPRAPWRSPRRTTRPPSPRCPWALCHTRNSIPIRTGTCYGLLRYLGTRPLDWALETWRQRMTGMVRSQAARRNRI